MSVPSFYFTLLRNPTDPISYPSIFVTITCYFVAAVFYNRVVLGLRGREQLPSFSLSGLSSLKDFITGCVYRREQTGQSWGSWDRDRTGFGRLATDEQEAMMNGRFSIDEEDEGAQDNQLLRSGVPPGIHGGSGANGMGSDGVIRL